jgi:iron(III) transport system ATP-binding protein
VAIRPEAWQVDSTGDSANDSAGGGTASCIAGTLVKHAYLGGFVELTVATELGEIFVVSPDVQRAWATGQALSLRLGERAVSVVAAAG